MGDGDGMREGPKIGVTAARAGFLGTPRHRDHGRVKTVPTTVEQSSNGRIQQAHGLATEVSANGSLVRPWNAIMECILWPVTTVSWTVRGGMTTGKLLRSTRLCKPNVTADTVDTVSRRTSG